MKATRIVTILLLAALCLLASCRKKDYDTSTTSYPSLSGLYFDIQPFGRVGQTFTLTPKGTTQTYVSEDPTFHYYWKINGGSADTTDVFTFIPDTLGAYTIQVTAYASGFISTVYTGTVDIIDPTLGKTLTGTGIKATDPSVVDSRGGDGSENTYYYSTAGGLDFFRNNLAYTGSGRAYMDTDVTSYILGRYYTWEEAVTACPPGWRLPTLEEVQALFGSDAGAIMTDAYLNETKMWEYWPQVKVSDEDGFYAFIPSGYANNLRGVFDGLYSYAAVWTSTEDPSMPGQANYFYINVKDPATHIGSGDKTSLALSVRCVR